MISRKTLLLGKLAASVDEQPLEPIADDVTDETRFRQRLLCVVAAGVAFGILARIL